MTLPLSKFEFNNLSIEFTESDDLEDTTYTHYFKDRMSLVNTLYKEIHNYEQFRAFDYKRYIHKVVKRKKTIKGYNLKGELQWTINWTGPTKNS